MRLKKKNIIIACAIVVVIAAGTTTGLLIRHHFTKEAAATHAAAVKNGKEPGYQTLLPGNASIATLGGWQRVSPPDSDPVFAYADTIDNVAITVSEQPLPFKDSVDTHVEKLAEQYNATDQLHAGATTVYVGTSAKGPQSVILAKKNLLILIKSKQTITDKAWLAYINSLR